MEKLKLKKHTDEPAKKHHKKSKKKQKKEHVSSDSSDSESDKFEWVENTVKSSMQQQREDWMCEEEFVPTFSKQNISTNRKQQEKDILLNINKEIQNKRELNPYWKDNGKGLPEKDVDAESLRLPSTSVGDGGYSWLKKAYRRIEEQANKEGRSMEDVAVERWGSLDKLVSMIDEAESRMKNQSVSSVRIKHRIEEPDNRHRKMRRPDDDYSESSNSYASSSRFRKPQMDDCHSSKPAGSESKKSNSMYHKHQDERQFDYDKKRIPSWKKSKPKIEDPVDATKDPIRLQDDRKPSKEYTVGKCPFDLASKSTTIQIAEETSPDAVEVVPMTEEEITKLSTKYHKAELMGNVELANKLKNQLDEARKMSLGSTPVARQTRKSQENIVLSKIDSSGQSRPIYAQSREEISVSRQKVGRSKKNEYFDEDSKYSLKQMFEREKLTTVDDHLEMFLDVAAESKDPNDQDYDLDDVSNKFSKKMSHRYQETKDIGKAIYQHQRLSSALERCQYCLDQPNMKKHLIISIGSQAYLCLPPFQAVIEGHCLIVPKNHVSSCLYLDEDEWLDIKNFKEGLRKMFRLEEKCAIFLETSLNFRSCPHAVIECIPMPKETADLAPLYFKKAIQESEAEWCHNKKLVDLTSKGLRSSVPKELPYFCVEFDPDIHRGYAHVIEEEKYFPRNFGKEVIGGMLDIDYNYLYKNRKEDPIKKSKEVLNFEQQWKKCNPDL